MTFIVVILAIAALRADPPAPKISLFIVSEEKIPGGHFIDTKEFPKLGYIAATPDLVITRLKSLSKGAGATSFHVDANGKETRPPDHPGLLIRLHDKDAPAFIALSQKTFGKVVLFMINDKLVTAPLMRAKFTEGAFTLELPGQNLDALYDELKKMVE